MYHESNIADNASESWSGNWERKCGGGGGGMGMLKLGTISYE